MKIKYVSLLLILALIIVAIPVHPAKAQGSCEEIAAERDKLNDEVASLEADLLKLDDDSNEKSHVEDNIKEVQDEIDELISKMVENQCVLEVSQDEASLIDWNTSAAILRGNNGKQYNFVCLPSENNGTVWGTDIYTDDSSICSAATHAGIISQKEGGTVRIQIRAGQESYEGTERNGIASVPYGKFAGSFHIATGTEGQYATMLLGWDSNAAMFRGLNGWQFSFICPSKSDDSAYSVWGVDAYTDDSSICTAAVHAGVIDPDKGGGIAIEVLPGSEAYKGSTRNGVTSAEFGAWQGGFKFVIEKEPQSLQGMWMTVFGPVTIDLENDESCGTYVARDSEGKAVEGELINCKASKDNTVLEGDWEDKNAKGTFRFTLNDDGNSFRGSYSGIGGGEWNGLRISGGTGGSAGNR